MQLFQRITAAALAFVAFSAFSLLPTSVDAYSCPPLGADDPTQSAKMAKDPNEVVIGVVIYDGVTPLDFIGPTTYFEMLGDVNKKPRFVAIANRTGLIQPPTHMPLYSNTAYTNAPTKFDILLIPGGPTWSSTNHVVQDQEFVDYVTCAAQHSTIVFSVCTGSHILSHTGLLDGRNATTNKVEFRTVAAARPSVNWVRHARWVIDGKYWTSSGVSAGADMANAFITAQYGEAVADHMSEMQERIAIKDANNDPFEYLIDQDVQTV